MYIGTVTLSLTHFSSLILKLVTNLALYNEIDFEPLIH